MKRKVEELKKTLTKFLATQHYIYYGKDGTPVLARELEDERDELRQKTEYERSGKDWRDRNGNRAIERQEEELMKTYTQEELNKILHLHSLWLEGNPEGVKANLESADLQYANLRYADLRYANLQSANLRYADLRYANLDLLIYDMLI